MIRFLVMQIRLGKVTLDKIPEKYRADVEQELGDGE